MNGSSDSTTQDGRGAPSGRIRRHVASFIDLWTSRRYSIASHARASSRYVAILLTQGR